MHLYCHAQNTHTPSYLAEMIFTFLFLFHCYPFVVELWPSKTYKKYRTYGHNYSEANEVENVLLHGLDLPIIILLNEQSKKEKNQINSSISLLN